MPGTRRSSGDARGTAAAAGEPTRAQPVPPGAGADVPLARGERLDVPAWIVDLAHDMRSPLMSILFLSETIRSGGSGSVTDVQGRQLALMYGAAFRLAALVDDVIDMRRGGQPLLGQQPLPFAVSETFGFVSDLLLPIAEEKGLALEFTSPAVDLRVGYPLALGRAVLNLAANALRYTETGSVRVSARELDGDVVEFVVADTGPGVPPEELHKLAEPMAPRGDGASRVFRSSGLGLAICRQLVEAMGGELRASSRVGVGTSFRFSVQLPPADE